MFGERNDRKITSKGTFCCWILIDAWLSYEELVRIISFIPCQWRHNTYKFYLFFVFRHFPWQLFKGLVTGVRLARMRRKPGWNVSKRKLAGKTCLRVNSVIFVTKVKFVLYWTNFRLKTTLSARLTWEISHCPENICFYKYFCVKQGFCTSPVIRASDFTWTNFSPADRAPPFESSEIPAKRAGHDGCHVK
jgi:hypothetical protein